MSSDPNLEELVRLTTRMAKVIAIMKAKQKEASNDDISSASDDNSDSGSDLSDDDDEPRNTYQSRMRDARKQNDYDGLLDIFSLSDETKKKASNAGDVVKRSTRSTMRNINDAKNATKEVVKSTGRDLRRNTKREILNTEKDFEESIKRVREETRKKVGSLLKKAADYLTDED
jgi:hypothetical protein